MQNDNNDPTSTLMNNNSYEKVGYQETNDLAEEIAGSLTTAHFMVDDPLKTLSTFKNLFPPHPEMHGKLDGLDLVYEGKIMPFIAKAKYHQFLVNHQATDHQYAWHLTQEQSRPRGIAGYPRQGDTAFWLCLEFRDTCGIGEQAADRVVTLLVSQGLHPYRGVNAWGEHQVFAFTPEGGLDAETVVTAGRLMVDQLHKEGFWTAISIYPALDGSVSDSREKHVHLPYRGAIQDPDDYGNTCLSYEGIKIPLNELAKVKRSPQESWVKLAAFDQTEAYKHPVQQCFRPDLDPWVGWVRDDEDGD